jgi:mannose-6-phosphate isomerase-like protein (cupin superfamily)
VSALTLVPPGGGEIDGDAPDRRVEILAEDDALHATWTRFGPRRDGAEPHVHYTHTDLFYVLDGELAVTLGGDGHVVAVPAGTLVRVPPVVVHGFRNASDADVRYLNLHAPGRGFAEYLRAMRDRRPVAFDQHPPPPDGGRSPADAAVGTGELVADRPGLRIALLADVDEMAAAEIASDPDAADAPPHRHRRHVESLYVLDGELAVTAGGRAVRAGTGTWLQVPAGVPHAVAVAGGRPARFLELHTPGCGFGTYVRGLGEAGFDQEPA